MSRGNGRSDVFHADGEAWWVSWDGTSTWQELNRSRFMVDGLAFGDFDGDGKTDVSAPMVPHGGSPGAE